MIKNEKIIKLGLIGVGKWGKNYVKTIKEFNDISLAAVCSNNEEVKNIIPEGCKIYKNLDQIIKSDDLDGLILCTPTNTHYSISKEILKRGIPLLSEKPLATNLIEIKNLLKISIEKKTILMVNYIHLYHYGFENLIKLISSNAKELLENIYSESGNNGPFRDDTRALWDWGVHDIAMSLRLINEYPSKIKSNFLKESKKGFHHGEIIQTKLYFPSGVTADLVFGNLFDKKIKKFTANTNNSKFIYDPLAKDSPLTIKNNFGNEITSPFNCISGNNLEQPLKKCIRLFSEKIKNKEYSLDDLNLTLDITKIIHTIENQLG